MWEIFEVDNYRPNTYHEVVTIQKVNQQGNTAIRLNKRLSAEVKDWDCVQIMFNPDTGEMGIKKSSPLMPNSAHMGKDRNSRKIDGKYIKRFCEQYKIDFSETRNFKAKIEGDLIVAQVHQSKVVDVPVITWYQGDQQVEVQSEPSVVVAPVPEPKTINLEEYITARQAAEERGVTTDMIYQIPEKFLQKHKINGHVFIKKIDWTAYQIGHPCKKIRPADDDDKERHTS